MEPSFVPAETEVSEPPPDPAERERVEDVLRTLNKVVRVHQLYEGRNPALDRFLETLQQRLGALWEELPALELSVEERRILWRGMPVYTAVERSDNLAFLFFRDGLRELVLLPGFEDSDLSTLVAVLARVHRLGGGEDDLLTLLWELDLPHLRYRYVDALADSVTPPGRSGSDPRVDRGAVQQDMREQVHASVSVEDFQDVLYFLDESELRALADELRREDARDLWAGVLTALFDRLEDGVPPRQAQILAAVADLLPALLASGNVVQGAAVLRELALLLEGGTRLAPHLVDEAHGIFEQIAHAGAVEELLRSAEVNPDAVSGEDLAELLAHFPPSALGSLIRGRAGVTRPAIVRAVDAGIEHLAQHHPGHVVTLVADEDEDEVVLAGAVSLAGRLAITRAAPAIARLLGHSSPELRVTAIEALQTLRTPTAAGALTTCLKDGNRDVRIAAARALGALRYPPARSELEETLSSRRMREADVSERIAFFEAFGSLAGADGVPLLDRMLNGKSFFRHSQPPELRASAARGLGRIPHPMARAALARAAADADPVVRSEVGRALKGPPS